MLVRIVGSTFFVSLSSSHHKRDPIVQKVRSLAEKIEEKGSLFCCLLLTAVTVDLGIRASLRPFWFDELFTYYIARLETATIWKALVGGAEAAPPLDHLATRLSQSILGTSEFGTRFPALAGFVIAAAFLFRYVSTRFGSLSGLSAVLIYCLTGAYLYGSEARPYGIVLACCAIALWSWSRATDVSGTNRSFYVALLFLSLTTALGSHFYATLLLIPLGVGEIVRTLQRRRLDWLVWSALVAPVSSLALYLPMIRAGADFRTGYYSPAGWGSFSEFYVNAFSEGGPLMVVAVMICLDIWWHDRRQPTAKQPLFQPCYPQHELAALLTLLLLPVLTILVGVFYTNIFLFRYAIASLLAFSALVPAVLHSLLKPTTNWKIAFSVVLFAGFLAIRLYPSALHLITYTPSEFNVINNLPLPLSDDSDGGKIPIVITSPLLYPVLFHYAPAELRARLIYVADPVAAFDIRGVNIADLCLLKLNPWSELRVELYRSFMTRNDDFFLLHASDDLFEWITYQIDRDGKRLTKVSRRGDLELLRCCK